MEPARRARHRRVRVGSLRPRLAQDALDILKLGDLRVFDADWGQLPDISQADPARDTIFTWNGTTTGVRVKDASWISDTREGLTLCDATSAIFAQRIDFSKIDVLTYSWQKVLGGEAAHGMLIMSPRAFARLESYEPPWPIPRPCGSRRSKILRDLFGGVTINTPSMRCAWKITPIPSRGRKDWVVLLH